jgi:hypothetical protein
MSPWERINTQDPSFLFSFFFSVSLPDSIPQSVRSAGSTHFRTYDHKKKQFWLPTSSEWVCAGNAFAIKLFLQDQFSRRAEQCKSCIRFCTALLDLHKTQGHVMLSLYGIMVLSVCSLIQNVPCKLHCIPISQHILSFLEL